MSTVVFLFSFQRLQASSKVSCSSAGRDRSTSGPFRAEAQGFSGKLGGFPSAVNFVKPEIELRKERDIVKKMLDSK